MASRKKSTKPQASKQARLKDLEMQSGAEQVRGGTPPKETAKPKQKGAFEVKDFGFDIEQTL